MSDLEFYLLQASMLADDETMPLSERRAVRAVCDELARLRTPEEERPTSPCPPSDELLDVCIVAPKVPSDMIATHAPKGRTA